METSVSKIQTLRSVLQRMIIALCVSAFYSCYQPCWPWQLDLLSSNPDVLYKDVVGTQRWHPLTILPRFSMHYLWQWQPLPICCLKGPFMLVVCCSLCLIQTVYHRYILMELVTVVLYQVHLAAHQLHHNISDSFILFNEEKGCLFLLFRSSVNMICDLTLYLQKWVVYQSPND